MSRSSAGAGFMQYYSMWRHTLRSCPTANAVDPLTPMRIHKRQSIGRSHDFEEAHRVPAIAATPPCAHAFRSGLHCARTHRRQRFSRRTMFILRRQAVPAAYDCAYSFPEVAATPTCAYAFRSGLHCARTHQRQRFSRRTLVHSAAAGCASRILLCVQLPRGCGYATMRARL